MRTALSLVIFSLVCQLSGCSSDNSSEEGIEPPNASAMLLATSQDIDVDWEGKGGIALGEGFNTVSYTTIQQQCFDFTEKSSGSVTTDYRFDVFDSIEDLTVKLNGSYSASSNYGVYKGSVKANAFLELDSSSNNLYAHAYYKVLGPSKIITDPVLKSEFKNLTNTDFIRQCGDHYLAQFDQGASLEAYIQITASNKNEKMSIKASLKEKSLGTTVEASTHEEMKKFLSQHKTKVIVVATGCKATEPISTYDGFLTMLKTFYADTRACLAGNDNSSTTTISKVTFKSSDPYKSGVRTTIKANQDALDDILDYTLEYKNLLGDIDHIVQNEVMYVMDDPATYTVSELQTKKNEIIGYQGIIQSALNTCGDDPLACTFPSDKIAETYFEIRKKLPKEKNFYPTSCKDIADAYGPLESGENFTIYLGGNISRPVSVYCDFDQENTPTYLTLSGYSPIQNTSAPNFYTPSGSYSSVVGRWKQRPSAKYDPDMVTSWHRIHIIPHATYVEVDMRDYTYTTTYTNPSATSKIPSNKRLSADSPVAVAFGYALGGYTTTNPYYDNATAWKANTRGKGNTVGTGKAKIDLTGTPFTISQDDIIWKPYGYVANGFAEFVSSKVAYIEVNGSNGDITPYLKSNGTVGLKFRYSAD